MRAERAPIDAPDVPTLPFGWATHYCPVNRMNFYCNAITNATRWPPPEFLATAFGPSAEATQDPVPTTCGLEQIAFEKTVERNDGFKKTCGICEHNFKAYMI